MERLELIIIIICGIFSVGGLVLSLLSVTRTDNSFNGNIVANSSSNKPLDIAAWVNSAEGKKIMNKQLSHTDVMISSLPKLVNANIDANKLLLKNKSYTATTTLGAWTTADGQTGTNVGGFMSKDHSACSSGEQLKWVCSPSCAYVDNTNITFENSNVPK